MSRDMWRHDSARKCSLNEKKLNFFGQWNNKLLLMKFGNNRRNEIRVVVINFTSQSNFYALAYLSFKIQEKKIAHQLVNSNLQILMDSILEITRLMWRMFVKILEKSMFSFSHFFTVEWKTCKDGIIEEEILKKLDASKSGKTKCSTTFYHKVTRVQRSTIFFVFHYNLVVSFISLSIVFPN